MSYQVIARKWRPQIFTDMVGQDHITQTLTNALKNGRLPHALIFTGPRGTGKTSSARILAKSLRCPNAKDFIPCDECTSCLEISQSRSVDVIEIDGASNNGVDSIRELRDSVSYRPATGTYKVYIIDEVHMLSTSAFNALLKTLEEPPSHVVFIMATTEVQKIPATILSRCQRYDFRRIPTRQITQHLAQICKNEKLEINDDALWLVAKQGDGSMRDSQSLLDQVITFANGPMNVESVTKILGLTDRTLLFETLQALIERAEAQALALIRKLNLAGVEPTLFAQELLEIIRDLLFVKISGSDLNTLVDLPDSEITTMVDLGAKTHQEEIQMLFDMALKSAQDIAKSQDPRLVLEMALMRMVTAPNLLQLKDLLKSIETGSAPSISQKSAPVAKNSLPPSQHEIKKVNERGSQSPSIQAAQSSQTQSQPHPKPQPQYTPQSLKNLSPQERWLKFIERTRQNEALFAAKLENLIFVKEEAKKLILGVPQKLVFLKDQMNDKDTKLKLQSLIDSHWGPGYAFEVTVTKDSSQGESAQTMVQKSQLKADEELKKNVSEHPMVKAAQNVFKGHIKSVVQVQNNEKERGNT